MKKFWPDRYLNLSFNQKETMIEVICDRVQHAIEDVKTPIPNWIVISPTLEVSFDNNTFQNEYDAVVCASTFIIEELSVNYEAIREYVENVLFSNPDFYEIAMWDYGLDPQNLDEEVLKQKMEEIYEKSKFNMEKYLEEKDEHIRQRESNNASIHYRRDWEENFKVLQDKSDSDNSPRFLNNQEILAEVNSNSTDPSIDTSSLSHHDDYLEATVVEIHHLMHHIDYIGSTDGKTHYLWSGILKIFDKCMTIPFTLYDYKHPDYIYFDKPIRWHIGARNKQESREIKRILELKLERDIRSDLPF